ncbi:MAG: DUF4365 domain-containing protein [Gemmataceae bacterium]|nr:DUF4365 domain-containing protein [Gemmataceae bacterium]
MTTNNQKELFSIAFVQAVAAAAGYNVNNWQIDDDSVDIGIGKRGRDDKVRSPRIDLQLKCTAEGVLARDHLAFRLPMKNYDDLRHPDYLVPRLLVVVTVPEDMAGWLAQTDDRLELCHSGYWVSLRGRPEVYSDADDPKVTVHVPKAQPFTVEALRGLMAAVGRGEKP